MKKFLILLTIFLFCTTSYSQEYKGLYAKASASVAYPCPTFIVSGGYEFNRHFAIGLGVGVLSPAFYDICFPLSVEISGDITKKNIIGNAKLCYSIEPMIFGRNLYWFLPKIGLRNNNFHFYLTMMGVNFSYKINVGGRSNLRP